MEKHIPMRRCVGCMQSKPKEELNRYTKVNDVFLLDETKTRDGRGVYLCKESEACLKKAGKRGRVFSTN